MDRPEGFSRQHKPSRPPERAARSRQKTATKTRVRAEKEEFRRFTHATRVRRRRWGISLGSLGALVLSVVLLTLSPALSLQKVVVEGAERLQPGEVAQALNSLQGEPLARVSTERVGNALAPLSLIQAFETRIEPPGTLVVTIVERKPIGAVAQGSQYSVVDAAGVKLWESAASPLDLPIILVAADQNSPSYGAVSRVLLALPDELLSRVDAITATTLDDVRFSIRGASHEVVWGSSNRAREKARVLTAALRAAGSDPSQIIDVTTPESVVIRAKG